jgi:hypothetical protein
MHVADFEDDGNFFKVHVVDRDHPEIQKQMASRDVNTPAGRLAHAGYASDIQNSPHRFHHVSEFSMSWRSHTGKPGQERPTTSDPSSFYTSPHGSSPTLHHAIQNHVDSYAGGRDGSKRAQALGDLIKQGHIHEGKRTLANDLWPKSEYNRAVKSLVTPKPDQPKNAKVRVKTKIKEATQSHPMHDVLASHGFTPLPTGQRSGIGKVGRGESAQDFKGAHVYQSSGWSVHTHPKGHWMLIRHANGANYTGGKSHESLGKYLDHAKKSGYAHDRITMVHWGRDNKPEPWNEAAEIGKPTMDPRIHHLADNPPGEVPKHHHAIWGAVVRRGKHTDPKDAMAHYRKMAYAMSGRSLTNSVRKPQGERL